MLGNVQSFNMVLTGNSMGIVAKFGINTTLVALKMEIYLVTRILPINATLMVLIQI